MANWQRNAIDDLRTINYWTEFLRHSEERLAALDADIASIHSALKDATPVQGGTSTAEDRLISNIDERGRLEANINSVNVRLKAIRGALDALTADEQLILDRFFINRVDRYIDRLCDELNIEQAQVYRRKDEALRHFTKALYGFVDN